MRQRVPLLLSVLAAAAVLVAEGRPVAATELAPPPAGLGAPSDPCGFFRSQAYGRGLDHFLTEMLWACEAIATRRAAGVELSERLEATELALDRYRIAVIEAGAAVFARGRSARPGTARFGTDDTVKASLAATTGTLAALEAIRSGF